MFLQPLRPRLSPSSFWFPPGASLRANTGASAPFGVPYDVFRLEDRIEVWMDLPGLEASEINLTVSGRSLEISGSRKRGGPSDADTIASNRTFGDFKYHLQLGSELDATAVRADYVDGVLKVALPLAEKVRPRKITVGATIEGNGAIEGNGEQPESANIPKAGERAEPEAF